MKQSHKRPWPPHQIILKYCYSFPYGFALCEVCNESLAARFPADSRYFLIIHKLVELCQRFTGSSAAHCFAFGFDEKNSWNNE
jgi:hypothetical protein